MRLSKTAYYADFGIYGVAIALAITWGVNRFTTDMQIEAFVAAVAGMATWTLVEYLMHRFVFHGESLIAVLHGRHHAEPSAFIATPTWISAGVIAAFIFLPLWLLSSVAIATGFSAGFVVAFLWYGIAHHLMHHGAASSGGLLRGIARRHFLHHRSLGYGNFGLTTQCWDRLFGTCLTSPRVNVTR